MRILITGGTGFVGTHLVRFLKTQGSQISVLASGGGSVREPGVEYHEVDIRDAGRVHSLLREVNPERIYHLAGVTAVNVSWQDPRLTYEVNVFGSLNLFAAAMNLPEPPRILNVSTSQVYGPVSGPLTEESPLRPDNPYAASKAMVELLVFQYRCQPPGGIITARSFNHSGPGQSANFVLPSIAKQFAEIESGQRPPTLNLGNVAVRRDITDVRDVVRAYCMLAELGRLSEVYNVCSGGAVLISDVIRMFEAISGIQITIEIDADKLRPTDAAEIYGDPGKLEADTSWRPQIALKKTLEDMLNYWRSHCRSRETIGENR